MLWCWLSSVVPVFQLYGFMWTVVLWSGWFVCLVLVVNSEMLLGQQRKSGGCSFSALKLSNQPLFSKTPLPLLSWDPSSPSSKTVAFYEHCVTGWSFSISFPLLARPLFSWYSAAGEVNLLSILFLSLQYIRSLCQIFKASLSPKLPDDASGFIYLWMLWAFKPRRNSLSLPIKRFQQFLIFLYKWHQFYCFTLWKRFQKISVPLVTLI